MDRISYLPQSILHHILLRLPDEDIARTSVLSKAWHDTWSTFPYLVFDESRYQITKIPKDANIQQPMGALLLNKYKFCIWVSRALSNFQCKGLAIRTFKLFFESLPPPDLLDVVNHLMELVCDSGVEILQLDNGVEVKQNENPRSLDSYEEFAWLPLCVLEANSLIKLDLSWYFRVDEAFLNHPIKFSSLKVLSLTHVYLGDKQVIQNLILSCPLIEKLELVCCFGLQSVSIHGLPKLKEVFIIAIEEVDIDGPSLENLFYGASGLNTVVPSKINMDKCANIRELCLVYVNSMIITDQWFLELFQKFSLLEELILDGFYSTDIIKISSNRLKVLHLCHCYDLVAIVIDAPNLYEYRYQDDCSILPSTSILNYSSQLVLDLILFVDYLFNLEDLTTFLEAISPEHIPVSLFLGFCDNSTLEFDPFELQDYEWGPPSIKHMTLCTNKKTEEWTRILVTNLFWRCRPSIISFDLDSNKTLVKIFCEKLLHRKEDDCCCSSSQIKCWWHFLKDVKVSSSFWNRNDADDLNTLLEPFATLTSKEEEEISRFKEMHIQFWLEWQ